MASAAVKVKGLRELDRALKHGDKATRDTLRAGLKEAAAEVAGEARSIAQANGLVLSGKLVRSIRPGLTGTRAYVQADPKNRGYRYAGRYEFGDRLRPFLTPAAERKQDATVRHVEKAFDRLVDDING